MNHCVIGIPRLSSYAIESNKLVRISNDTSQFLEQQPVVTLSQTLFAAGIAFEGNDCHPVDIIDGNQWAAL